ncbi:hypothetical protein QYF36_024166 [Acer negundo]|nr:hypothetical protein QYF36_024166 [Acer negundo]
MSSVTDENTVIRMIFQRPETVRSSLLNDVELFDYFSFHTEEFIDSLLFRCRPTYIKFLRGRSWLSADQIVAVRQELKADFNSYIDLNITTEFNRYRVGGAISPYNMIATGSHSRSAVHNQDITQCHYRDAPVTPDSVSHPHMQVLSQLARTSKFKYVERSITSKTQIDWHLQYLKARGFNEEAYSLNQTNDATSNHQNITQWHPGWDSGIIQLVTCGSSDSLTDPIVASREELQADFTTPLNSETTEANNVTGSHNQGSPNSIRVEEQPLFNQPRFLETLLAITSQAALTILTIQTSGGSTSFSQNQKILFCSSAAFNVVSFLSFLFAILVRGRRPEIARIMTGTGFICSAYAFIGIMGMLLKDNIILWVTALAGVALFPVFASAFVK